MNYCNGDKNTESTFCNPCPYEGNCEECTPDGVIKMDRKKVIKALEVCRDQDNPPGYRFTSCKNDCPYYKNGCARKLKEDSAELLKEHHKEE